MSTTMAPNVKAVSAPGKRTVYSMCGMCAVPPLPPVAIVVAWPRQSPLTRAAQAFVQLAARAAAGSGGARCGTKRSTTSPTS